MDSMRKNPAVAASNEEDSNQEKMKHLARSNSQAISLIEELIVENNYLKDKKKQLAKQQNAVKTLGTRPFVPQNQICYVYDERMKRHQNVMKRQRNRLCATKVTLHGWQIEHPVCDSDLSIRTLEAFVPLK